MIILLLRTVEKTMKLAYIKLWLTLKMIETNQVIIYADLFANEIVASSAVNIVTIFVMFNVKRKLSKKNAKKKLIKLVLFLTLKFLLIITSTTPLNRTKIPWSFIRYNFSISKKIKSQMVQRPIRYNAAILKLFLYSLIYLINFL